MREKPAGVTRFSGRYCVGSSVVMLSRCVGGTLFCDFLVLKFAFLFCERSCVDENLGRGRPRPGGRGGGCGAVAVFHLAGGGGVVVAVVAVAALGQGAYAWRGKKLRTLEPQK